MLWRPALAASVISKKLTYHDKLNFPERSEMVPTMFAHIVGIPVEETALNLAPIAAVTGGLAGLRMRSALRRRSRRKALYPPRSSR